MGLLNLFANPTLFILWIGAILIGLSVHEFSHALAATLLGDTTARRQGRLTLNPLAHIDWFGLLALVLVGFGWGKPVPFNPYNLKDQKWGPLFIGLAGPASNLVLMTIFGLSLRLLAPALGSSNLLIVFLTYCFLINIALMIFNLLPFPPLDGSEIVLSLMQGSKWWKMRMTIERYGSMVLMALILLDIIFDVGIISLMINWPLQKLVALFGLTPWLGLNL